MVQRSLAILKIDQLLNKKDKERFFLITLILTVERYFELKSPRTKINLYLLKTFNILYIQ